MGTVSLTLPNDGDTIDAADVNTPLNAIAAVINGDIDDANIQAGGVVPNALVSGTGTSWAWQSWTPTWTTVTVGNGTHDCKYIQVGKTVICRLSFTFGSTSAMGTGVPTFTLPVTAVSYTTAHNLGTVRLQTAGANSNGAPIRFASTTTADIVQLTASGSNILEAGLSSTSPGTWTTGSILHGTFAFEAA